MINNARTKQRGCVITLLDLKNAFAEGNPNLLVKTLKIHHVPDVIITLVISLYTDCSISIITDTCITSYIKVQRGFPPRNSLSPLLSNLVDNTAFAEGNHNLFVKALKIRYVPDDTITIIMSLYTDYSISIITDTCMTSPIKVQRGLPQGDGLSPLLCNLVVYTLINIITSEKVECVGYVYNGGISLKHWFQFADDTVFVIALKRDIQLLGDVFLKWPTLVG